MNPIQHNNIMYRYIKHSMCRERTSALLDVTLNALKNNMNFILFSYLMIVGAIDWNICTEVLGMTKGQMFQSIAPETIK